MTNHQFRPVSTVPIGPGGQVMCESFTASVSRQNGFTIVVLAGRVALGEATTILRGVFEELPRNGAQCILLDMRELERIDSAGLAELIHLAAVVHDCGGELFGVWPRRSLLHGLLKETRVAGLIYLFDRREPAVQAAERWVLENSGE
jgi:anti-anti-sigma factor